MEILRWLGGNWIPADARAVSRPEQEISGVAAVPLISGLFVASCAVSSEGTSWKCFGCAKSRRIMKLRRFDDIDYAFRPESYTDAGNPLQAILKNVQGARRRRIIHDYFAAGRLEELTDAILLDVLSDDQRAWLEAIHPSFMGGEYLPPYRAGEVEIARIELQSTTADVISVRAQPANIRMVYSICDEYDSTFTVLPASSVCPLTLAELIGMIDNAGFRESLGIDYTVRNYEGGTRTAERLELLKTFTRVESIFYPQITLHYRRLVQSWYLAEQTRLQT